MADIILYKDSPQILNDFASDLKRNLVINLNSKRRRYRYKSKFKKDNYTASSVKRFRSGSKRYRASKDLVRSIDYKVLGTKIYISFNEYGVMLDRGSDGYKLKQFDKDSLLADADIDYNSGESMAKEIARWTKKRGLKLRKRILGTVGKALPNTPNNRKKLNFLITRSLMNRGQNATFWFTAPYKAISEKLPNDLIFGMINNIDDSMDLIFKKWHSQ